MAAFAQKQYGRTGTSSTEQKQSAEHDGHLHGDTSAIATACLNLVKVAAVGRSTAKLASRPVVAVGAVALALVPRVDTTGAWRPVERRGRCIWRALDAADRIARRTCSGRRVGSRTGVACRAIRANVGAIFGILAERARPASINIHATTPVVECSSSCGHTVPIRGLARGSAHDTSPTCCLYCPPCNSVQVNKGPNTRNRSGLLRLRNVLPCTALTLHPSADARLIELENRPAPHGTATAVPRGHCR
eukprot:849625-Prymnesium_polylepis.2